MEDATLTLTMNQWGLVLKAIRAEMLLCREAGRERDIQDLQEHSKIEDLIIDLAFKSQKDTV